MTHIIDGNAIAQHVRQEASAKVAAAKAAGVEPGLAVFLVGDDPASASYVRMKAADCEKCGIRAFDYRLPATISQEELNERIDICNADPSVHGILVQMPVPAHLDAEQIIDRISFHKDVDGFHPVSLGRLVRGVDGFKSCTPWGIMRLLDQTGVDISGKRAVVVGRSTIVGKPMALMLLQRDATVTICHSRTGDLPALCREADILIAAVGRPRMITADFVKKGAVVIDVGINRTDNGLVGDVDFEAVAPLCQAITPVPGGVGPMTRAILMDNTATAALRAAMR